MPLTVNQQVRLFNIQRTFGEDVFGSLEKVMENYSADLDPEREIKLMEYCLACFLLCDLHRSSFERRDEAYTILMCLTFGDHPDSEELSKRRVHLTEKEFKMLVANFSYKGVQLTVESAIKDPRQNSG